MELEKTHQALLLLAMTSTLIIASCETGMPGPSNVDAVRSGIDNAARRVTLSIISALEQGDPDDSDNRAVKADFRTAKIVSCPLGGMRDIQDDGSIVFDGCQFFPGLPFSGDATYMPGANDESFRLDFSNFMVTSGGTDSTVEGFINVVEKSDGSTTYQADIAMLQTSDGETFRHAIKSDLAISVDGDMTGFLEVGVSEVGFEDFDSDPTRCDLTGVNLLSLLNDPSGFDAALAQTCGEGNFDDGDDTDDGPQSGDLAVFGLVEMLVHDAGAQSLADVSIMVLDSETLLPLRTGMTGADGRFNIVGFADGQEVVIVASRDDLATFSGCRTVRENGPAGGLELTIRLAKANTDCQTDDTKFELIRGDFNGDALFTTIFSATEICTKQTVYDSNTAAVCINGDKAAPTFGWASDWNLDGTDEVVTSVRVRQSGTIIYEIQNLGGISSPIQYGSSSAGTIVNGNDGSTPLATGNSYSVSILTGSGSVQLDFEILP